MLKRGVNLFLILALMIPLATGCGANKSSDQIFDNKEMSYEQNKTEAKEDVGFSDVENSNIELTFGEKSQNTQEMMPKIIQNIYYVIETQDFETCITNIESELYASKGYIENSSVDGKHLSSSGQILRRNAYYRLRVPKENSQSFLKSIGNVGAIVSEEKNSEDVTFEYFDKETRLDAKRLHQKRLFELMEKTENVDQLITLQEELAKVTYEIESMTTALKKWDNLIDYVTVSIDVREVHELVVPVDQPVTFGERIVDSFNTSLRLFGQTIENIIISLVYMLPYLLIIGIVLFFIIKSVRKMKIKRIASKNKENHTDKE